jgi:mycofactocin system FadH/OYE family oxidoreductase 2
MGTNETYQFRYLFRPIQVGPITIRNRIAMSGHQVRFAKDSLPTDQLVHYYGERAKGGVGLIITGAISIHPSYPPHPLNKRADIDEVIPGFKKISNEVHKYGGRIFAQLSHVGKMSQSGETDFIPIAPSKVINLSEISGKMFLKPAREMTKSEIKTIAKAFADSARRAKQGELDGVEIHMGHGYLFNQFFSPMDNRRTDEYGGDIHGRMRFAIETLEAIRKEVGREYVIGVKVSADEFREGGLSLTDMQEIVSKLDKTSLIDFISVSGGNPFTLFGSFLSLPPMEVSLGNFVFLASSIKDVTDLPVICVSRINDPVFAEKILEEGSADIIAMTRAAICDPHFPNKALNGNLDEIVYCVACNQGCIGRWEQGYGISCLQNPTVGKEREWGQLKQAERKRKVVVVGGGPGGMKASEILSKRGHEVILLEQQNELGGHVLLASRVSNRAEFGDVVRNLKNQLRGTSVKIKLGVKGTAETILAERPDVVILATGSEPYLPSSEIYGIENSKRVSSIWQILKGEVDPGRRVLVVDEAGFHQSYVVVGFLLEKERAVTLISSSLYFGTNLEPRMKTLLYKRLYEHQVNLMPHFRLKKIDNDQIWIENVFSLREEKIEGIDTIVLSFGNQPVDGLDQDLENKVEGLFKIGDCLSPRTVMEAIYEGYKIGITI